MASRGQSRFLLVVTEDGYAKRVPLEDISPRRRGAKGVCLSSVPVAAVMEVDGTGDLVIATGSGQIERIAVGDVPVRRRRVLSSGRLAKGALVVRLAKGDRVASVASSDPPGVAQCPPPGREPVDWPWGTIGLRDGERFGQMAVLHPPHPLDSISTGGQPVVPRDEWANTDVHQASTYFCAHCGEQYAHPEDVYGCIDAHAVRVTTPIADKRAA